MCDKYKYIGLVYDFLSNFYSGKNIYWCKIVMLDVEIVCFGDCILFVGVGYGWDVIWVVELGVEVMVVDLFEIMLCKFVEVQQKEVFYLII